eukprot:364283-Chlamydomonas_euryale.AAC.7
MCVGEASGANTGMSYSQAEAPLSGAPWCHGDCRTWLGMSLTSTAAMPPSPPAASTYSAVPSMLSNGARHCSTPASTSGVTSRWRPEMLTLGWLGIARAWWLRADAASTRRDVGFGSSCRWSFGVGPG